MKLDDKGQAIFEFIIFLPLLIFLFMVIVNVGSSINASINQQKATRGYFYRLLRGNSLAPTVSDLVELDNYGLSRVGMSSVGWRSKSDGQSSLAPCFRFNPVFTGLNDELCEDKQSEEKLSNFIKVYTFYGLCSATYIKSGGNFFRYEPQYGGSNTCVLR